MRTLASSQAAKILATVVLVSGAAGVAGIGTFGAFTDTTTADVEVSAGNKIDVLLNDSAGPVTVPATGMLPGDKVATNLSVSVSADSAEIGTLTASGTATRTNDLSRALRLDVDQCSVPWQGERCTGTRTDVHAGAVTGTTPAGWQGGRWVTALNNDEKIHLRVVLELPANAPDSVAGQSTTLRYSLTANQRTAKTTTVTPVPAP